MGALGGLVVVDPETAAAQRGAAGPAGARHQNELSGIENQSHGGSTRFDGEDALRAAQCLRACMPAAVTKYHGNLEGYEWWEQHETLFEEARLQWGMRDPCVYRLISGPKAVRRQRPLGVQVQAAGAGVRDVTTSGESHEGGNGVAAEEDGFSANGTRLGGDSLIGTAASWLRRSWLRQRAYQRAVRRPPLAEALWVRPEVRYALAQRTPGALHAVLDEVCCDSAGHRVYALDLLEKEFCDRLLAELDHIELSGIPLRRPNGMNRFGAILSNLGFQEALLKPLMQYVVMPFAHSLWPEWVDKADCDETYGFVVRYRIGEDVDLAEHADTSNVTLNVCLGRDFEGGDLYFKGVRFTASAYDTEPMPPFKHRTGRAVIHLGGHFHGVLPITSGERSNLVLWATGQGGVVRIRPNAPRASARS